MGFRGFYEFLGIEECDCNCCDCYRLLEFEEFCQLSAKFLIEEDEEGMKRELKEAFRIYDKAGTNFVDY